MPCRRCLIPTRSALAAFFAMAAATPASAQDLTYFTTTTMEVSGTLGRILSMVTKIDDPIVERTYLKGSRVRKDQDQASSIMDWSAGALTLLDHSDRTFMRFDFTQMAGALRDSPPQREPPEGPEVEVTLTTDRTGKRDVIAGYAAEQVVLVIEIKPENAAEAAETPPATTALVTDLWLSTEFPEYRMTQEMAAEALEQYRRGGGPAGVAQAMGALAGSDPAMRSGWEKNMEAVRELQGTVLRSTTHFVSVPPGATLDTRNVLETAGERVQEGGGVAQGAANAARQALGGLAGRFGRNRQQQEAPAAPTQAVIMRVRSEISDVHTDAVAESMFDVPAGYTVKAPPGALKP